MKAVKLEDVVRLLMEYGYLQGMWKKEIKKPTHGSCCMCQDCGYWHDECVCLHNETLEELNKVIIEVRE